MQVNDGSILDYIKNNGKLFTLLSAIGGFISDVLQPLAPFSEYIFYTLLIAILPLTLIYYFFKSLQNKIVPFLSFAIIFAFISGVMFGLQLASNNKGKGVLSAVVPGIEEIQRSLGLIDKKLISIKEDTEEIKKSTKTISSKLDILGKQIGKQGGIISNPSTFAEWYSNARHYELKGDFLNARKSYLKYFTYKEDYIDPHLHFFKLLKIQEGRSGAREIYTELKTMYPSIAIDIVYALSLDNKVKIKELERLASKYPTYSPILYILSKEFSPEKRGEQTLEEIKIEKNYLEKFVMLAEDGAYLKYYLDKNEAAKDLENAKIRLNAIKSSLLNSSAIENPVTLSLIVIKGDMLINIDIPEIAPEVSYSYGENTKYYLTPIVPFRIKGRYIAEQSMTLPLPQDLKAKFRFKVKYKDIKGQEHGPFDLSFVPWDEAKKYELMMKNSSGLKQVKKVDGKDIYKRECSSCHGINAEKATFGIESEKATFDKFVKIKGRTTEQTIENMYTAKLTRKIDFNHVAILHMDEDTIEALAKYIQGLQFNSNDKTSRINKFEHTKFNKNEELIFACNYKVPHSALPF